jgi:hypothetical protein
MRIHDKVTIITGSTKGIGRLPPIGSPPLPASDEIVGALAEGQPPAIRSL